MSATSTLPRSSAENRAPQRTARVVSADAARPDWIRRLAVTVVGVTVVAAVAVWVTTSALFHMRRLEVTGNRHVSTEEVASLAGLGPGTNVFWVAGGSVARRIEANPWVRTVRVSRSLPSTISVSITERTAVAVVSGPRMLVAADGTVLGPAGSRAGLPSIEVQGGGRLRAGSRIPSSAPALVAVRALPPELRGAVRSVRIDPVDGLILELREGALALYGDASDALAKGAALEALVSWAEVHGVTAASLDVRAPDAPALRPTGGSPSPVPLG